MAKIPTQGTVLKMDIASVMTAVSQVDSLDKPLGKTKTMECTPLEVADGFEQHVGVGIAESGTAKFGLYFDPANTVHKAIQNLIPGGVKNWSLTYNDADNTEELMTSVGVGMNTKFAKASLVMCDCELVLTGNPAAEPEEE